MRGARGWRKGREMLDVEGSMKSKVNQRKLMGLGGVGERGWVEWEIVQG